jgi:hypothetical protein
MVLVAMTRHGGAGVEPEPAESQNEAAHDRHRDMMPGDGVGGAVGAKFSKTRAEDDGARQGGDAAGHVHHRGAGEIEGAVSEPEALAQGGKKSAAPHPVGIKGIDDHGNEEAVYHE